MTDPSLVRQEPDRIDARRVVLVLVGSLVIGAVATAGSRLLRGNSSAPSPHSRTGPAFAAGAPEHGPFDGHERGGRLRAAQIESLNHYSRTDRAGVAHIPIARAIELELGANH